MTIYGFQKRFKDEEACMEHLKNERLRQGITCKHCETKTKHYWLKSVNKFQCCICRSRTNLRAGTVMENSNMPLQTWFMVIHMMTSTKTPFSALEVQRNVEAKRYEPIWYMMLKIRLVMGKRDEKYMLKDEIEMDEGFFEAVTLPDRKQTEIINKPEVKRGRGSDKQAKVLVMVESRAVKQEKPHKKKRILGFIKMETIDDASSKTINYVVDKFVEKGTIINTDNWRGYSKLGSKLDMIHKPEVTKPKEAMEKLPWCHTMISNCKRNFLGVFHSVNKKYLQPYLNEFCYKLNRRTFKMRDSFDGLMTAAISTTWN